MDPHITINTTQGPTVLSLMSPDGQYIQVCLPSGKILATLTVNKGNVRFYQQSGKFLGRLTAKTCTFSSPTHTPQEAALLIEVGKALLIEENPPPQPDP